MSSSEPPRDVLDRSIRKTLQTPANLRDFLHSALPQHADRFDCDRARFVGREFVTEDWRGREADLPFEVPYRTDTGEEMALVCLLVEHQSDTDVLMPLRLLYFALIYWSEQWREWEALRTPRPTLRLRPVVPIVLYTGEVPWGSNRVLTDLMGDPEELHVFAPRWEPLFWNLADRTAAELLQSGAAWLQGLAVLRARSEDANVFDGVFRAVIQELEKLHPQEHVRWEELLQFVMTHVLRLRPADEHARLKATLGEVCQPQHSEEVKQMTKTIADALIEEGEIKGKKEGREEGVKEGVKEGELRGVRIALQLLLKDRFQEVPQEVNSRIETITDIEQLRRLLVQVYRVGKLDDLQM